MLKLTPLEETVDGKELLRNHCVEMLTKQIQLQFTRSAEVIETVSTNLRKLELHSLKALFKEILKIGTVEELETWIDDHTVKTG